MTTPTQDTITARLERLAEWYEEPTYPRDFAQGKALIAADIRAILSERATLKAELEEARGVLEPFAKVAEHVEQFDPDYPDDGAALRASFDWFDSRLGEHQSLRFSAFRAARAYLTKEPTNV